MARDLRSEVTAALFQYHAVAEPLRIRAFAQLITKALFLAGDDAYLSIDAIRAAVADIAAGATPGRKDIVAAIDLLKGREILRPRNRKFGLKRSARRQLDAQLAERRERISAILMRHFPRVADESQLAIWLDRMCVAFFVRHSTRWVASMTRGTLLPPATEVLLQTQAVEIAHDLSISVPADRLLKNFDRFLKSELPEDNRHLWTIGMAAFAARLVAAGSAADPISIHELRDRTFLLDTNVLLAVALESDRYAQSLAALGLALSAINVELVYTQTTLEEYQGVIDYWQDITTTALETKGPDVVRKASDQWIRVAVKRGCMLTSDFVRFFDELRDPPGSIEETIPISLRDTPEVAEASRAGSENEGRVIEIQGFWATRRPRAKSKQKAAHDAALSEVAERLTSEGNPTSVVTLDRTMHELALEWSRPLGEPLWILLDALIQVLALDRAGPSIEATDFAPLFMSLVAHDFEPGPNGFQIEDLQWLDELEQDVGDLPPEQIEDLAKLAHRLRMAGLARTDPELRLALQREYQRAKGGLAQDVNAARGQVAEAREESLQQKGRADVLESELASQLEEGLRRKLRVRWGTEVLACLALAVMLSFAAHWVVQRVVAPGDIQAMIEVGGVVFLPAVAVLGWVFRRVIPGYQAANRTLPSEARRLARSRVSDSP